MVRLIGCSSVPASLSAPAFPEPSSQSELHFCARFDDLDAALMHFHSAMPRRLADLDAKLYRASVEEAVVAADAIMLAHRRVYIDPTLAENPVIGQAIERRRKRHKRWSRTFDWVGYVALVALLVLTFIVR
jgi:hypothetical protein